MYIYRVYVKIDMNFQRRHVFQNEICFSKRETFFNLCVQQCPLGWRLCAFSFTCESRVTMRISMRMQGEIQVQP